MSSMGPGWSDRQAAPTASSQRGSTRAAVAAASALFWLTAAMGAGLPASAFAQAPLEEPTQQDGPLQDLAGRLIDRQGFTDRLLPPVELPSYKLPRQPLDQVSRNGTSVGTAEQGTLVAPVQLPVRGAHHAVLPAHRRRRHLHWGTVELLDLVSHAAGYVAARYPGSVLQVGNLSARRGGDIPYSHSHNSGRDVDLAFYMRRDDGRPYRQRNFRRLARDGRLRGERGPKAEFDVPRNWALVEALLGHPTARVQWVLVADHLRTLLLAHARSVPVDRDLLQRAERVLAQPRSSGTHDDHFHVRVYCAPDDLLDGCRPTGPRWAWIDPYEHAFGLRVQQLLALFRSSREDAVRQRALARLVAISASEAAAPLAALLPHEAARWRVELARTLANLGDPSVAPALLAALEAEQLPEVAAPLIEALGQLAEPGMWEAVAKRIPPGAGRRSGRVREGPVALAAASALGRMRAPAAVPRLIPLLGSRDPALRRAAAESLQRICNRRERSLTWWRAPRRSAKTLAKARTQWRRWWNEHRLLSRADWLVAGFRAAGYRVNRPLEFGDAAHLVRAAESRRSYVRSNAEAALRHLARMRPTRAGEQLLGGRFWRTWWYRTRRARRLAG